MLKSVRTSKVLAGGMRPQTMLFTALSMRLTMLAARRRGMSQGLTLHCLIAYLAGANPRF